MNCNFANVKGFKFNNDLKKKRTLMSHFIQAYRILKKAIGL